MLRSAKKMVVYGLVGERNVLEAVRITICQNLHYVNWLQLILLDTLFGDILLLFLKHSQWVQKLFSTVLL